MKDGSCRTYCSWPKSCIPDPVLGLGPSDPADELTVVDVVRVLALCLDGVNPSLP